MLIYPIKIKTERNWRNSEKPTNLYILIRMILWAYRSGFQNVNWDLPSSTEKSKFTIMHTFLWRALKTRPWPVVKPSVIWLLTISLVLSSTTLPSQAYFVPVAMTSFYRRTFVFATPFVWTVYPKMLFLFVESLKQSPQRDFQGTAQLNAPSLFTLSFTKVIDYSSQHITTQHIFYI